MAFIQLIVAKSGRLAGIAGQKVMLNTDYVQGIEPDPQEPTVTLVKMADGKSLRIVGDYDAVSSQITSAHHQASTTAPAVP